MDGLRKRLFPCPLCAEGLEIRESKKGKPYVVCYGCGVQIFVRAEPGIRRLSELVKNAEKRNIWDRLSDIESRYKKKCPECGKRFWISEELIKTSWLDGQFVGYRCPEEDCDGIVGPEVEQ